MTSIHWYHYFHHVLSDFLSFHMPFTIPEIFVLPDPPGWVGSLEVHPWGALEHCYPLPSHIFPSLHFGTRQWDLFRVWNMPCSLLCPLSIARHNIWQVKEDKYVFVKQLFPSNYSVPFILSLYCFNIIWLFLIQHIAVPCQNNIVSICFTKFL